MKKVFSFVFACIFSCSTLAFAVDEPTDGAVPISKGQAAPFSGVLLTNEAVAKILADKEYQKKKCEMDTQYELEKQKTKQSLELGLCKIDLELGQKKYEIINKIKDDEITRVRDIAVKSQDSSSKNTWYLVGGIALGILASVGVTYAVMSAR